ncbi:MAG TPA: carboxypeptidase-like regulatory domain-containing protein, partial [Pirellulales bacterium]|nr:carboxypeptidase-like regulatory domain-containing protein [Pirellulales bacterium]
MKRITWFPFVAIGVAGIGLVCPTGAFAAPPAPAPAPKATAPAPAPAPKVTAPAPAPTPAPKVTTPALAPAPAAKTAAPAITDVTLGAGGSLQGQVLNSKGAPVPQTTVTVKAAGSSVTTVTDSQGNFSVAGVKGGVVEANAAGSTSVLRAWTPEASPPSACKVPVTVTCDPIVRGQSPGGPGYQWPTEQLGCHLPECKLPPPGLICR